MVYKEYSFYSGNSSNPDDPIFSLGSDATYVHRFKVLSALIPMSEQSTNAGNNTIAWMEGATLKTASVAVGNHTLTTWPSAMQTAMNSVSSNNYVVTYDILTRTLKVQGTTSFQILAGHSGTSALRYTRLSGNRNQLVSVQTPFGLRLLDASTGNPVILKSGFHVVIAVLSDEDDAEF